MRLRPLTFYGHFSGFSSYPVVCQSIARWMIDRGVDLRVCNLRDDPVPEWLAPLELNASFRASIWNHVVGSAITGGVPPEVDRKESVGFFFGFPQWLPSLPRHDTMTGYFVPDIAPAPPVWKGLIEGACDLVLTPSKWGQGLLAELDLTRGGTAIPLHVVPHGIDPDVFSPAIEPKKNHTVPGLSQNVFNLRHFSSSPTLERKGTRVLLSVLRTMLQEPWWDPNDARMSVLVHVQPCCVAECRSEFAGSFPGGSVSVLQDVPSSQDHMASVLRRTDLLLQPSRAEGFGCLPLESVACGTPVVLLGATGEAEYLDDIRGATYKVESEGLDQCGEGVAPVLTHSALRATLDEAVRDLIEHRGPSCQVESAKARSEWAWSSVLDRTLLCMLKQTNSL